VEDTGVKDGDGLNEVALRGKERSILTKEVMRVENKLKEKAGLKVADRPISHRSKKAECGMKIEQTPINYESFVGGGEQGEGKEVTEERKVVMSNTKLFISSLLETDEGLLRQECLRHGPVEEVNVVRKTKQDQTFTFGFATFVHRADAEVALRHLREFGLDGRQLRTVQFSQKEVKRKHGSRECPACPHCGTPHHPAFKCPGGQLEAWGPEGYPGHPGHPGQQDPRQEAVSRAQQYYSYYWHIQRHYQGDALRWYQDNPPPPFQGQLPPPLASQGHPQQPVTLTSHPPLPTDFQSHSTPPATYQDNPPPPPAFQSQPTPATSQGPLGASSITAELRARIMQEVLEEQISPADLSKKYNISAHAIRDWVKKAGRKLPKSYKRRNMPSTSEPVFKKKKSPRKIVLTKMMTIDDSSEEEIDFPFYPPPPARALQVKAESVQDHNVKIKNEYLEEEEGEVKKENIKGDMTINMKRENKTERGEMKEENFEEEGGEVKKETIKVVKKDNMKKERMTEIEEVKEENNSLKKEISRLQEENAGLRLEKREWKSKIKQEENTIKMEEVDEVNEPSKVEGKDGKGGGGN